MLISGFTIIRNAEIMDYPVVPAIRSILPIVDEFVVGVGQSDDDTRALIESIGDPKIRIVDSFWDTTRKSGGVDHGRKDQRGAGALLGATGASICRPTKWCTRRTSRRSWRVASPIAATRASKGSSSSTCTFTARTR
jgi:hypothetical protein